MIHVLDRLPKLDEVCIIGKGPSVEGAAVPDMYTVSINESYHGADLCIFNDWWLILKLCAGDATQFATTSAPHVNVPPGYLTATNIAAYGSFFKEVRNRISYYDIHHLANFPDKPVIQSSVSTAESAIHIFALLGCKKFHFLGVGDQPAPPQYAAAVYGYKRFKKQFGLTYTGSLEWL